MHPLLFLDDSFFYWWPTDVHKILIFYRIDEIYIFFGSHDVSFIYYLYIHVMYFHFINVMVIFYVLYMSQWWLVCNAFQSRIWLAMWSTTWFWLLGICENVIFSKLCSNYCKCRYFWKRQGSWTLKVLFNYDMTSWESRNTCIWLIPNWEASAKRPMKTPYSTWLLVADPIQIPF